MDYAVWNTLHDGSIASICGSVPGDVTVHVEIGYLCAKLPTGATYVVVHLRNCLRFEYHPFDEEAVSSLSDIAALDVEVLSADAAEGLVSIECVKGVLTLAYERAQTALAEGRDISQSDLEAAAHRYWTEWEENNRKARGGS